MVTWSSGLCSGITTQLLLGIVVVRKHIARRSGTLSGTAFISPCEIMVVLEKFCQRLKSSPLLHARLQTLPVFSDFWESVLMKFVFGFPADSHKNTIILVFSDRFSNIVHLVTLPELITASHCACVVIVIFFRLHGLPREPMFYRDPRFTDKL